MKPFHWIAIVLGILALIFLMTQCGGTPVEKVPEPEYTYKCNSCKEIIMYTPTMIEDLKKAKRAVAEPGSMLKLECTNCTKIEASPFEPYPASIAE